MDSTRYKILLIEDNKLDQMAFKRFVDGNAIPYDCTVVGSVAESGDALRAGHFDIIITDHSLGDGTALDVLQSAGRTPVIVVTGAGDEETAVKTWKAGAYDYLVKDIDQSYLKAIPITVENAIRHRTMEDKLQLLSGAVMSTQDSVYITDMEGTIVFVNKAFCRTYGYREEEIVGQNGNTLWIGKRQSKSTRSVFQTKTVGSNWEVGFYHRRKDDSVFPVSLSRAPVKDSAGRDVAIVAVARDITERILVEDEIRTASLKLKKRNQFQNDVAILVGEAVQKLLGDGRIETARQVIADHVDLARITSGNLELATEQFDLSQLVSCATEDLKPTAVECGVKIGNATPPRPHPVSADRNRTAQVLTNLLRRAIESSSRNGLVSVDVKDIGCEFAVEIADSGSPLEHDEFQRAVSHPDWIREQFDAGREDMAFGLRLAKELVELQGGRLWAEASDTKRNTVCFTLPKSTVPHAQSTSLEVASARAN